MKRTLLLLAVLLFSGSSAAVAEMPWGELPEGAGRAETFSICSACHSFDIIATQGLNRDQWDETLAWMTDEQGMAQLPVALRMLVLDYLAAAFPQQSDKPSSVPIGSTVQSLPAHEGRDETFAYCSACHSMRLVAQQGLDREEWEEILGWMEDEEGMVVLPEETRERVLDYLFRAFPAQSRNSSR